MIGNGRRVEVEVDVSLPILTKILAHPAKTLGDFGLVAGGFTNCYQLLPFGPSESPRRSATFTSRTSAAKAHNTLDDDD